MQKVKPEQKSSHKSLSKTIYRRETGHFYGDQESATCLSNQIFIAKIVI